ncbi:NAD(P)/FAD-dependent oxidoreductase [Candidatus Aenigmatarchaeota archaeon]
MYDVLIIGAGPAGLTAGVFAVRRNMKTLVLNDPTTASQTDEASMVDDWPGVIGIKGPELMKKFREHAEKLEVEIKQDKISKISKIKGGFEVINTDKKYQAKTIIIATGSKHRKGLVKGEDQFAGKGVSYCATCDGPLFKGKKVLVLGGGDTAVTYAILLDDIGAETGLVQRRDKLRATESWQKKLFKTKVKIHWDTVCIEIKGDKFVKSAVLQNKKTGEKKEVPVDGVFVAFGTVPTSGIAKGLDIKIDKAGYIEVDRDQKTNVPGVFAAGDCCNNAAKKIVTAAGDGGLAAENAYFYLKEEEK